jgi:hypothetical protein
VAFPSGRFRTSCVASWEDPPVARQRLCLMASASGNGKTTLARTAAAQIGVRFVELDALVHGPGVVLRRTFGRESPRGRAEGVRGIRFS